MKAMLANTFQPGKHNPVGWWMSEKLDGVRALWDGNKLVSRTGKPFYPPEWWTARLPDVPLDGELWLGRGRFQETVSVVRRTKNIEHEKWEQVQYLVFDIPTPGLPFAGRYEALEGALSLQSEVCKLVAQQECGSLDHLQHYYDYVLALGGEGLMVRCPKAEYAPRRSPKLLKMKPTHTHDAIVVGYQPGKGKHEGRLGALVCRFRDAGEVLNSSHLKSDKTFEVGTGFTDLERERAEINYPLGSVIEVNCMGLTDGGLPRFPAFKGLRGD